MIQLEMSKAFDKISWGYMRQVLEAFGFHKFNIKWIMAMVSGAFFSILMNGSPCNPSILLGASNKEIPSPFLFVIMAEGFSRSIFVALHSNKLAGLQPYAFSPPYMHQQFVDDTLLMGLLTIREASSFKSILSDFCAAFGTTINLEKSKLFFFNTPLSICRNIARLLDFPISTLPSNYLGVPLTDRPLSRATWEDLINKLEKRNANWTFRFLNLVGHLVLVKFVLWAILLYLYSAAPKVLSNKIRNL